MMASIQFISLLHASLAAVAVIYGVQLLKPPPSQHSFLDSSSTNISLSPSLPYVPKRPPPLFLEGLEAYDFDANLSKGQSDSVRPFSGLNDFAPLSEFKTPSAGPFLLAAVELAMAGFSFGLQSLLVSKRPCTSDSPSPASSLLALYSPLLALCSAAQFVIWSSSVHVQFNSSATISSFLIFKMLGSLVLTKVAPLIIPFGSTPLASTSIALISVAGLNLLSVFQAGSFLRGQFIGYSNHALLIVCAFVVPIGPWMNGGAVSATNARPWHMSTQALLASLLAFLVSIAMENVDHSLESVQYLAIFAALSFMSSGSQLLMQAVFPIIAVDALRDQLSFVLATMLGLADTSGLIVEFLYLIAATVLVYVALSRRTRNYFKDPNDIKDNGHTIHIPATLFTFFSALAMGLGLYFLVRPASTGFNLDFAQQEATLTGNNTLSVPGRSNIYEYENELQHQRVKIPANHVIGKVTTVLIKVDPSFPPVKVAESKQAKPFAVTAKADTSSSGDKKIYVAPMPSINSIPKRAWDHSDTNVIPRHAADLTFDHLQIGLAGNPRGLEKPLGTLQSWARTPGLNWNYFWLGEDEPSGMVGEKSFLMESFKKMMGKYPIVMKGQPGMWYSLHVRWFKMLPYMYQEMPSTTRWFLCGDDDTILYPDQLLDLIKTIPEDPLTTSMHIGGSIQTVDGLQRWGEHTTTGGAGILISRHLAKRMYDKYEACIDEFPDLFLGDCLMSYCAIYVTNMDGLGPLVSKRLPSFTPGDMQLHEETGREFWSARMSRAAPVTIHHWTIIPSMMVGMSHIHYAAFDFWHLTYRIPMALRFRRFFIHLEDGRTAVVTHGFHVRMYSSQLKSLDHPVDFDSNFSRDTDFLGIPWMVDTPADKMDPNANPVKRDDYVDYWILHNENNVLVYANDDFSFEFRLGCKDGDQSVLSLCSHLM